VVNVISLGFKQPDELQAILELLSEGFAVVINMIEAAEFEHSYRVSVGSASRVSCSPLNSPPSRRSAMPPPSTFSPIVLDTPALFKTTDLEIHGKATSVCSSPRVAFRPMVAQRK
jgi:hypothetical protein